MHCINSYTNWLLYLIPNNRWITLWTQSASSALTLYYSWYVANVNEFSCQLSTLVYYYRSYSINIPRLLLMWLNLRQSTMWAQITWSYIFANIFRSKHSIPIPQATEEIPLHSAVVMKIFCGSINSYKIMIKQKQKNRQFFELRWSIFAGPVTYI